MLFFEYSFLFVFLPAVLAVYYLIPPHLRNGWLLVSLESTASPPDGYGARVVVETKGGARQLREVHYSPVDHSVVHFGLGATKKVKSVEVTWPSGAVSRIGPVRANRHLTIVEPAPGS